MAGCSSKRRSPTKDLLPGFWDIGAGGVVGVGETDDEAAVRELVEELGISGVELTPLGRGSFEDDRSREDACVYRVVSDGPFEFVDGEVAEIRFVTRGELEALMATEPFAPACAAMILPMIAGFGP